MGETALPDLSSRRGFLGVAAAAAGSILLAGCADKKPSDAGFVAQPPHPTPRPVVDPATALNNVLAIEYQAIYTYDALARLLTDPLVAAEAAGFRADHEAHRDALIARLGALGATPVAAKTTYSISPAPTDQAGALKALAAVENTAAKTGYASIAGTGSSDVQAFLVTVMGAEAQHAAIILAAGGQEPIGPPFQTA